MQQNLRSEVTIEDLRAELDAIDRQFLEALRARIEKCVEIGHFKREHGVPMMQPQRIGVVQERAARYGAEHSISQEFLRDLYDLIIAETCRVEDVVIAGRSS
ncbi:chorismate mutase family protein [Streptomyces sp. M2CJ-2]|uniref:chorismate mutase family protein n=1 Tax=unclassified Streptomyces TaxID=2593676 RepID=UPI000D6818E1|nr:MULTISPECIES: chorismate mutase family protein [unclassified Streptomyces]MBL3671467.1 chorismate mutase family protein [Streptomyces sp. M2CJ-2]PWI08956.1 4-amino-4-deoxychorismate mutase [Streptomyces sp. NWU339]